MEAAPTTDEYISSKPVYNYNKNIAYNGHKVLENKIINSGISGVNPSIKEPTTFSHRRYTSEASRIEGLR